jgi:hypothetical protein
MTFFARQTELPQPLPKAADADLHGVFRHEPGSGKRRIGFGRRGREEPRHGRQASAWGRLPKDARSPVLSRRPRTLSIEDTLTRKMDAAA